MKATITTASLKAAIGVAGRAASNNKVLPALGCLLLDAHADGGLTVTGTNLEQRAYRTVGATVDRPGAVLLDKGNLAAFVSALTGEDVTITVNDKHRAKLVSGRSEITLAGIDPESFPVGVDFENPAADLTLAADVLADAVGSVIHACAPDESRPVLAGISWTIRDGRLTLATADGFRLAVRTVEVESAPELTLIVHGRGLREAARLLGGATSARVRVDATQSTVSIDTEAGTWETRLIDGRFPDFNVIVPRDPPLVISADRAALLAALAVVTPVAVQDSNIVRFSFEDDALWLRASNGDEVAESSLDVTIKRGEPHEVAYNVRYLRDAVGAFAAERITLGIAGPASPGVIHAGDPKAHSQTVMPMR